MALTQSPWVTGVARELAASTYDANGALSNAISVTVTVTNPNGATTSPTVTRTGTGLYQASFTPTVVGTHRVVWTIDGTDADSTFGPDSFEVVNSALAPAVGLLEVKEHLNITGADSDGELLRFMLAATSAIEQRVGPLTRRTVTETHDGGGVVMLRTYPVITLTTVTDNGITLTAGQYRERDGIVTKKSGTAGINFTTGLDGVSVTYEAGRTAIPADLRQAVLEQVRHMWETQRGQQRGRRDGDTFVAGQGYTFSNRVLQLIGPFELPSIA